MRAGCPVIAMKTSSIPEVAGNSAILLEEASSESIASAVMSLSTGEIREVLRASGLVQAEKFSWDKTYVATFNLYCEISGMQLGDFLSNEN
jgi:mannosyltransferase